LASGKFPVLAARVPQGMARAYVGTSGWRYTSWRGDFYPTGLTQARELEYLAERTSSVEVNGSFYSLLRPSTYQRIVDQTPDHYPVAVKGSRYITHLKRLRDIETPLANFLASGVLALGPQQGPFLWQLPASFAFDADVLGRLFDVLPRTTTEVARLAARHDDKLREGRSLLSAAVDQPVRHALEPRHPSFRSDEATSLLRAHDVAMVASDTPGAWPYFEVVTSDFTYVRLHGHTELYTSGYSPASLRRWADKAGSWIGDGLDVYVYFDNDARGRAPHDAVSLCRLLSGPGT
jgi:uncharacterized protein YecE (DUF72 family)